MPRIFTWVLLVLAGCHAKRATPVASPALSEVTSNVLRADYAGSDACAKCHPAIHAEFMRAPMHNMTRRIAGAQIRAPFAGETFAFKDDRAQMQTHEGERFMRLQSPTRGAQLFRITRVIGGHHREDFAGVLVDENAPAVAVGAGLERVLPVDFAFAPSQWRYKGYSVMTPERPELRPGAVWTRTCIFCHNTTPMLSTLLGTIADPSAGAYQGELVDPLLQPERRAVLEITDADGLKRALDTEMARLGGAAAADATPAQRGARAVALTRARFEEKHLVEVGIGCESCHGGSAEHVKAIGVSPVYEPRSSFMRVKLPGQATGAQLINRVCARCHQVLFTKYPWTWEGSARNAHPGGSNINSGEARDFLMGGCASQMSCVACHDPHAADGESRVRALEGQAGDAVCLRCHGKYSGDSALRPHSHHEPGGAGSRCLACHMPRKNMSLENRLTRYHRIGSPTDRARVEGDRPLECALCHADRTVAQLLGDMERMFAKRYDREQLTRLYGDLNANVVDATLRKGKPHEQAVAVSLLGDSRAKSAAPKVAEQLTHRVPIIRYYALAALSAILGQPAQIDLFTTNDRIRAAATQLLRQAGLSPASSASDGDVPAAAGEDGE